MTVTWIAVDACAPEQLPDEGEPVFVYTGKDAWLSRWKAVLADPDLPSRVRWFAPLSEIGLPEPLGVSRARVDEDKVLSAKRSLSGYYRRTKSAPPSRRNK